MIIRFGYVAIALNLEGVTSSSTVGGMVYRNIGFKRLIFPYTALESIIIAEVLQRILPCL